MSAYDLLSYTQNIDRVNTLSSHFAAWNNSSEPNVLAVRVIGNILLRDRWKPNVHPCFAGVNEV